MKTLACIDAETLSQLLQQSLDARQQHQCEQHLESCPRCREQLERIAGSPDWWQQAAEMLSSREAITPSGADETRSRLNLGASAGEKAILLKQVRQILEPAAHPELMGRLGNYDIESFIGQGGFGVVFKAHDSELNRPVAIKVLAPHLSTSGVARRRFAREAQAAAAVVHPNVVPIHAVFSDAECPYLVMTYVPGLSLQQFIQQHGPLEPKAIVRIAQQVAAGLAAAHRQGLVHRDIKPGNILLENGLSRALITDFGLARAADDAAASQTGWLAGTPHYMSPEQAAGGDLDGRSDLFSLGSVMYFLATGREPFRGEQPLAILQQITTQRPLSARLVNSDVPRTLSRIIDRLLEKKPQDRIQSAQELSVLLEEYLAHMQQPQSHAKPRLPRSRKQWQQFGQWVAAGVLSAAIGWWGIPWAWQAAMALVPPSSTQLANSSSQPESSAIHSALSKGVVESQPLQTIQGDTLQITLGQLVNSRNQLQELEFDWRSFSIELQQAKQHLDSAEKSWFLSAGTRSSDHDVWQQSLRSVVRDLELLENARWEW